jgi:hypothetical protein
MALFVITSLYNFGPVLLKPNGELIDCEGGPEGRRLAGSVSLLLCEKDIVLKPNSRTKKVAGFLNTVVCIIENLVLKLTKNIVSKSPIRLKEKNYLQEKDFSKNYF